MDSFLVAVVPSNLQSWSQLGDSGKQMIHLGMSTFANVNRPAVCTNRACRTSKIPKNRLMKQYTTPQPLCNQAATGIPSGEWSTFAAVRQRSYFLFTPACVNAWQFWVNFQLAGTQRSLHTMPSRLWRWTSEYPQTLAGSSRAPQRMRISWSKQIDHSFQFPSLYCLACWDLPLLLVLQPCHLQRCPFG